MQNAMQDPQADKALRAHFNSRARKVTKYKGKYLVPLRYDKDGSVLTDEKFDARKHYKKLDANDWLFLEAWKRNDYDQKKTQDELGLSDYSLTRLAKRLNCFKAEDFQDKALAVIPSTTFIQARHVENVLGGQPLDDSQRDSLKELAKIQGSYKSTTNINVNHNIIQISVLKPEEQQRLKEIGDAWQEAQVG